MNRRPLMYILGILVIIFGFSVLVMLLWNFLLPDILGVKTINFWQALGLLALSRLLFGGFGNKFWMKRELNSHHHNPIYERWSEMNQDQRRDFIRNRHHHHFGADFVNNNNPEKES